MNLEEMLKDEPPVMTIPGARQAIRNALIKSGRRLVVIDDDPTGTQTVQDVNVFMDFSIPTLRKALAAGFPAFFVSVNSRSLCPDDASMLARKVGRRLKDAASHEAAEVLLASRSDSTLRGHFPHEVHALMSGFGLTPDGIIVAPAFLEAGRFTIADTQWAEQNGELVPVHETEFARDPLFSFKNSELKAWIEEKTRGRVKAADVMAISLTLLRQGGPAKTTELLLKATGARPIIVNAAAYEDLDVLSLALQEAEDRGKKFIYRCSASFLKARGGFEDRALLTHREMVSEAGPGLIVAGSYVEKTSRQLRRLLDTELAEGIELKVDALLDGEWLREDAGRAARKISAKLRGGIATALYTSREMKIAREEDFAAVGKSIMRELCDVVRRIDVRPAYVVAKGGITSIEIAKTGLGATDAFALGQILPGVPVWRLGEGARWPGITYVVFPGNVGDDAALARAIEILAPPAVRR